MDREFNDRFAFIRIMFLVTRLGLSLGLFVIVHGQTSTVGSISGTVRDAQGAVISKAEVLIEEERTDGVLAHGRGQ